MKLMSLKSFFLFFFLYSSWKLQFKWWMCTNSWYACLWMYNGVIESKYNCNRIRRDKNGYKLNGIIDGRVRNTFSAHTEENSFVLCIILHLQNVKVRSAPRPKILQNFGNGLAMKCTLWKRHLHVSLHDELSNWTKFIASPKMLDQIGFDTFSNCWSKLLQGLNIRGICVRVHILQRVMWQAYVSVWESVAPNLKH